MASALLTFSRQADVQVMSSSADLGGLKSNGVYGNHSTREALGLLLKNTSLTFHPISNNAVSIEPERAEALPASARVWKSPRKSTSGLPY